MSGYIGKGRAVAIANTESDTSPKLGGDIDFNGKKATNFTSTGVDDNATSNAITVSDTGTEIDANLVVTGTSPQIQLETGASNYNWQMAAQESVAGAFEISSGSADADATNDTYTSRLLIKSSGNVGIGASNPATKLHLLDNTANAGPMVRLQGSGQNAANNLLGGIEIFNGDSSSNGPQVVCNIKAFSRYSSGRGGYLIFSTNTGTAGAEGSEPTERMRIDAGGDVKVNTGNLVIGTSGKGIDFSAVPDGTRSVSSNVLDDYEEGTWTPSFGGDSTTGVSSYPNNAGYYTKVGNLVSLWLITSLSTTTGTGNLVISGLPYSNEEEAIGSLQVNSGLVFTAGSIPLPRIASSKITFRTLRANGSSFDSVDLPYMRLQITYLTA